MRAIRGTEAAVESANGIARSIRRAPRRPPQPDRTGMSSALCVLQMNNHIRVYHGNDSVMFSNY